MTKNKLSPLLKHFLQIFIPALLAVFSLLGTYHFLTTRSEWVIIEAHELSHVYDGRAVINRALQQITSDLLFIAHSPILHHFLREPSSHLLEEIGHEYLNLSETQQVYDQIRYLDDKGREVVRVNYNNGAPTVVPDSSLQDKSKRYYFTETFSLAPHAIYVSPLDLNLEFGAIELPRKPMIRFGTPVFDGQGAKRGIVLLNYSAQEMLSALSKTMSAQAHHHTEVEHASGRHAKTEEVYGAPLLLNQQGYWLLGLREEDEWGFMFGNGRTFSREHPTAWQKISRTEEGQFETPAGLFTFITIYPLAEGQKSPAASTSTLGKPPRHDDAWKLLSFIDRQKLNQITWQYRTKTASLTMAFLLLIIPACWYYARMRLAREQAEQMAQRYEFIVNTSTDFMTLLDSDYRYLAASTSFCTALQITRQDILGKTAADVWGEEVFTKSLKPYIDQAQAGQQVMYSCWFFTPHLGRRYYDVHMAPLRLDSHDFRCCVVVSRDITEYKHAQDAIGRAKQDWERTFDAVPDLITILDEHHRIVRMNRAMAEGLGTSADQCVGHTCYELVHNTKVPHPDCPHTKLLQDGQVHGAEVTEGRIGGDFQVTTSPLHDAEGRLCGSVHIARDISASKKNRKRLERLNVLKEELIKPGDLISKLQKITAGVVKIFDADIARIWLIAPGDRCAECFHAVVDERRHHCREHSRCLHLKASSGRYTHIDGKVHGRVPYGCYKIGRLASESQGKFLTNDVVSDPSVHDHEWAKNLGLAAFAGYRLITPEAQPIGVLALFSKHIITDEEDALLESVAATAAQVIQTAQAEEALRQARDNLQTIVDNVDAMIYISDIVTYEVIMANAYIHERFGRIEGRRCWEVLQKGQSGPCQFCAVLNPALADSGKDLEVNIWEVQNSINGRWYECRDRLVRWLDNRLVRVQIATDITDRKETQQQLQEYAATQKTLLREVNHRVKNNLAAIIGMLHLEEDRVEAIDAAYANVLHDLVARIHGLSTVHTLLSAGEWRPIPLDHLCREVITASLSAAPQGKFIDCDVQNSEVKIFSDQAHHLALVLNELATNTVKHALPSRERVHLSVHIERPGNGVINVVFRDNGPGYPAEMMAGDMSRASIGLEIVQGIITSNLQGKVTFSNDHGAVTHLSFLARSAEIDGGNGV